MRVLYIGFAISDDMFSSLVTTDRGMPTQTQSFGWRLIEALISAGVSVDLISAEPATDYPGNSRVWIRGQCFTQFAVTGRSISFVNLTGFKHWTRFCAAVRASRSIRAGDVDAILVHGVHSAFLWTAVLLARRVRVPAVVVITDAPSIPTATDGRLRLLLKRIDSRIIRAAISRMAGAVVLAPDLADEVAPGRPKILMEGIAPAAPPPAQPRDGAGSLRVVYAGGLKEEYGVLDLVASVGHAKESWSLTVYGRGPAESAVRSAAANCERVRFAGFVPPEDMASIYAEADVLVNPRPPIAPIAARSFPSKLLSYLSSGAVVVTTDIPSLPHDYREFVVLSAPGAQGLADSLDRIARLSWSERHDFGRKAQDFIVSTRGVKVQGERMTAFIRALSRVSGDAHGPSSD